MGDETYDEEVPVEQDESVYAENTREELIEAGEISPEEDAFMKGYEEDKENKEDEVY